MTTDLNWTSLPGKVLEGGYEIQEVLAADQSGRTYKVRILGGASAHAVMKVFPAEGASGDEQIALWNSAKELRHPNLSAPLAAGRVQVDGVNVPFVILPRADEVLEDILRERPLAADEAGEVLLSAAQALDYLHTHGFVHGSVSPEEVLAIGESIKLSADNIRKIGPGRDAGFVSAKYIAPESQGENVTPEADVWCLGATLFETLTQHDYREGGSERATELPGVFGILARRCLDSNPQARCTAGEIPNLYRGRGSLAGEANPVPLRPDSVLPTREPVRILSDSQPRSRILLIVGVLALLVLAVIWRVRAARAPASTPAAPLAAVPKIENPPATSNEAERLNPALPSKNVPARTAESNSPSQPPAAPLPVKREEEAKTVNGPIWRVVLYTYTHENDAENMAHSLNEKHRGLSAAVFTPKGQRNTYLVVAGGLMTYDQALRLRRKAVRMGLPRDSYAQNYSQ